MNTHNYPQPHQNITQQNFQNFDFPEVELSDCESISMSLELENIHSYQIGNQGNTENFTMERITSKLEALDNSFNSNQGNCGDDTEENFYEQLAQLSEFQRNLIDENETKKSTTKVQKKIKKVKKKKRKRKRSKKQIKKLLMKKSSNKIMEAFAMEFDDLFSLYPTLTNKNPNQLSTFPQMFTQTEEFSPKGEFNNKEEKAFNSESESTMASDEEYTFSNVKSTLVKSKVSNLRASMLCFEMMANLKDMTQLSKCAKWERRLKYRQERAQQYGAESFESEDEEECKKFINADNISNAMTG